MFVSLRIKRGKNLAEREGFEPPEAFRPQQFSRLPVSTTHTPLRVIDINSLPAVENCRWIMTGRQSMPYLGNVNYWGELRKC